MQTNDMQQMVAVLLNKDHCCCNYMQENKSIALLPQIQVETYIVFRLYVRPSVH